MTYEEIIEKLALINSNNGPKIYKSVTSRDQIIVDTDKELLLSDNIIKDVFEWVDETKKEAIKIKGDTSSLEFKIIGKDKILNPTTAIQEVSGPNKAILSKLNDKINSYIVTTQDPSKTYVEISGIGFIEEEKKDEFDALYLLSEKLEERHIKAGNEDDVYELRMKVKNGSTKVNVPFYIRKNDINSILQVINILATFKEEFELPQELYQMKIDGTGFKMKDLPVEANGSKEIPEPKKASEKYSDYETRLETRFGTVPKENGFREKYPNEKYNYIPTVKESNKKIPGADVSGVNTDSLKPDPNVINSSLYYEHAKVLQTPKNKNARPTFTDFGPSYVSSEADEDLKTKIQIAAKSGKNFFKNHKAGIITTLLVVGGISFLAFNPAILGNIAKIFYYMIKVLVEPIPQFLFSGWSSMTVASKWMFIFEMIAAVIGVKKLIKYLRKKKKEQEKDKDKDTVLSEEQQAELIEARIQENLKNISDLEKSLISLENNYKTVTNPDEKEKIRLSIEKARASIQKAKIQIEKDRQTLEELQNLEIGDGRFRRA